MLNTKKKKIASVTSEISMFPVQRIMKHEQKIFPVRPKTATGKKTRKRWRLKRLCLEPRSSLPSKLPPWSHHPAEFSGQEM